MSLDIRRLFERLPAIYRIRDAEIASAAGLERGPLEELLSVFMEQVATVEENLEQLYDDLFIETCADWVIPYIGDLIGYRPLRGTGASVATPRAEVAHTIALRRRKGTITVVEQVARDVTDRHARAVEFFQLLATTQYMNHVRLHNKSWADLHDGEALEWIGTGFDSVPRTVDVRRIESGRGRYNIPNIGVFLWRINAYPRTDYPAYPVGPKQYRMSQLNHDVPLYGLPRAEDEITHIAEPENVPLPLSRNYLRRKLTEYYGPQADGADVSLILKVNGAVIDRDKIIICNLSGEDPDWAHKEPPDGRYAIDPELGRIVLPPDAPDDAEVRVTWHEGFSADLGGGEYERDDSEENVKKVPVVYPTIASALSAISGNGVIEITGNSRYQEDLAINVSAGGTIEIRAENGFRPTLELSQTMQVSGEDSSRFILDGLLVSGAGVRVPDTGDNALSSITLRDCTLVPGLRLTPDGQTTNPDSASLNVQISGVTVEIERSIVGAIRSHDRSEVRGTESIIDATDEKRVAFAAEDTAQPGGRLNLSGCTVIGKIHAREFGTVSDSILMAAEEEADPQWPAPVRVERKQEGCVRFSFLPFNSITPRRYRCQPDSAQTAGLIVPRFHSVRYGTPAYCQLAVFTSDEIRRGAEDESEMGVFHHLYGPQRESNLRVRLNEYMRVGLKAGIFYES
jgi:hypothetical protein